MGKPREVGMVLNHHNHRHDKGAQESKTASGGNALSSEIGIKGDQREYGSRKHRAERDVARADHAD